MIWIIIIIIVGVIIYVVTKDSGKSTSSSCSSSTSKSSNTENTQNLRLGRFSTDYHFKTFADLYNNISYFINDLLEHNKSIKYGSAHSLIVSLSIETQVSKDLSNVKLNISSGTIVQEYNLLDCDSEHLKKVLQSAFQWNDEGTDCSLYMKDVPGVMQFKPTGVSDLSFGFSMMADQIKRMMATTPLHETGRTYANYDPEKDQFILLVQFER